MDFLSILSAIREQNEYRRVGRRRRPDGMIITLRAPATRCGKVRVMKNDEEGGNQISGSGHDTQAKKSATKIRIIEDAEATGETAAAYDFWRAGSGRLQVPGNHQVLRIAA